MQKYLPLRLCVPAVIAIPLEQTTSTLSNGKTITNGNTYTYHTDIQGKKL